MACADPATLEWAGGGDGKQLISVSLTDRTQPSGLGFTICTTTPVGMNQRAET